MQPKTEPEPVEANGRKLAPARLHHPPAAPLRRHCHRHQTHHQKHEEDEAQTSNNDTADHGETKGTTRRDAERPIGGVVRLFRTHREGAIRLSLRKLHG